MVRHLFKILLAFGLFLQLIACGATPPVVGPNQSPAEMGQPLPDMSSVLSELPLVGTDKDGILDIEPGTSPSSEFISAIPEIIYTLDLTEGVVTSKTASIVKVKVGFFNPNTEVSIFGVVSEPDEIESPPQIAALDQNLDEEYVQLKTDGEGGLNLVVVAGYSPLQFDVVVTDGEKSISVQIIIQGPEEL